MALTYWDGKGWKPRSFARHALGADVYLCCPGPSLSQTLNPPDLHQPGIVTIAVNKAYPYVKHPDFWIGTDHPACFDGGLLWEAFPKVLRFCWREQKMFGVPIKGCPNTLFVDVERDKHALELWNRRLDNLVIPAPLFNSFEAALHLAVWLGARRIHFVGCDFGGEKDYHDDTVLTDEHRAMNRRLYREQVQRMMHHQIEAVTRGIQLVSCTPDSPLNGFLPYVPIAEATKQSVARVPQGWTPKPDARDAALCRWGGEVKHEKGVVVGVIEEQAWMLDWWYENFRKHNPDLPVAFADFGLAEDKAKWCAEHGLHFKVAAPDSVAGWFRKPFAVLHAPFEKILWLDLDCEVRGSLDRFFEYMDGDKLVLAGRAVMNQQYGTAQQQGWWLMLPKAEADASNEIVACTGLVGVVRGHSAIEEWALGMIPPTEFAYKGDHEVLAVVAYRRDYPRHQVSGEEFTLIRYPATMGPVVMHWAGRWGKERLRETERFSATLPCGHMEPDESNALMGAVASVADGKKCVRILEIGTAEGRTGHGMIRAALERADRCLYVGVDSGYWRKRDATPDFNGRADLKYIEKASQLAKPDVLVASPDYDVVFIDGCHCGDCVRADRDLYAPLVATGGILVFHDTKQSVDAEVTHPSSPHKGCGVRVIYEETARRRDWERVTEIGRWGLAILRRKETNRAVASASRASA